MHLHVSGTPTLLRAICRYYERTAKHLLQNSPYVDISNKWAGGGLVSNASDLVLLGNTLLQAYQGRDDDATTKFFLKPSTVKVMWTPIKSDYGWGWYVYPGEYLHTVIYEKLGIYLNISNTHRSSSAMNDLPFELFKSLFLEYKCCYAQIYTYLFIMNATNIPYFFTVIYNDDTCSYV